MVIKVTCLGAGQDVGRSCVIVELGGRRLMFDCGIHMVSPQQFPDFYFLQGSQQQTLDFTQHIDCVLITHFHLDHCGALTYFTEGVGYNGPVLATPPTKAIIPLMLEDFRKVSATQQRQSQNNQQNNNNSGGGETAFTSEMIKNCISKIQTIQLHETLTIKDDIKVTAYYAGHVLGACMFYVECNGESVVYTGDYNMTADRHLGSAWIDKLKPDLVITETTYATTIRDSKRAREREFLKQVHETLDNGGKVLIPVFALGRAQELCVLLETYWNRTNLQYPIYFTGGLTEKANFYYKLFINWTNEKIKRSFTKNQNIFQFQHVKTLDTASIKSDQPMVCFASPGMLHGGYSLAIFKDWAGSEKNTLIIPGYCMPGTVGNKLLSGEKRIMIDGKEVDVKIKIYNMSFSAHADSKGIMELLTHLEAKNVMLVHGEKEKMRVLSQQIKDQLGVNCYCPANHAQLKIYTDPKIEILIGAHIINLMNQIYAKSLLNFYRPNSTMYLSNCLISVDNRTEIDTNIEICKPLMISSHESQNSQIIDFASQQKQEHQFKVDQTLDQYEQVDMVLNWSQPISESIQDITLFEGRLTDAILNSILEQKKLAFGLKNLIFMDEELKEATQLAQVIQDQYLQLDHDNRTVRLSFGSLETDIGYWLKDILDSLN